MRSERFRQTVHVDLKRREVRWNIKADSKQSKTVVFVKHERRYRKPVKLLEYCAVMCVQTWLLSRLILLPLVNVLESFDRVAYWAVQ